LAKPTGVMNDIAEKRYKSLERTQFWITNCDTKCSFILAFIGIILTIIFTSNTFQELFKETVKLKPDLKHVTAGSILRLITYWLFWLYVYFNVRTIQYIFNALTAQTDSSVFKDSNLITDSLLFFGTVGKKSFDQYKAAENAAQGFSDDDLLSQILINSKIAVLKFDRYNIALKHLRTSILILVAYFTIHLFI
jgi:hypothetical protein